MTLSFQHLVSTKQLTREDTDTIVKTALEMEKVCKEGGDDRLKGSILASLFYEPSTRTRLSFEAAMLRLGGSVITADGFQFSSLYKGETIEDTMKMVGSYADIVVMRHPEQGSAQVAADASLVPFINAGDGPGQHPTQALLDIVTVFKERGSIEGVHVAMVGDLRYGRTVHSLSFLLGLYPDVRFTLVSPKELTMPEKVTGFFDEKGIDYERADALEDVMDADIVYMTRVQKERFADQSEYERLKDAYVLTADMAKGANATIMHPLPRVGEITADVDDLPNAAYFRQAENGVYTRMALLSLMLGRT